MSDEFEEVVDNLKTPSTWLRVLFMLGFCVILYVVGMVVMVLTLAQALFSIFSGRDNENLRRLGAAIANYVTEILYFITYNSESRPFPFAPFPDVPEAGDTAGAGSDTEKTRPTVAEKAVAKKSPPDKSGAAKKSAAKKKVPAKKTTVKKTATKEEPTTQAAATEPDVTAGELEKPE